MRLTVAYRGPRTIEHLTANYTDRAFQPIRDEMFAITLEDDRTIDVSFADNRPTRNTDGDLIHPTTQELLAHIAANHQRALNIPETLALGNADPSLTIACLGQNVPTDFGLQVLYVIRRGTGLLPSNRSWGGMWRIPTTDADDPLAPVIT